MEELAGDIPEVFSILRDSALTLPDAPVLFFSYSTPRRRGVVRN